MSHEVLAAEMDGRSGGAVWRLYRRFVSPPLHALNAILGVVPGGCRFQPTCSEYAEIAIAKYGWWRGSGMAASRLLRCHPFSEGGVDPVE